MKRWYSPPGLLRELAPLGCLHDLPVGVEARAPEPADHDVRLAAPEIGDDRVASRAGGLLCPRIPREGPIGAAWNLVGLLPASVPCAHHQGQVAGDVLDVPVASEVGPAGHVLGDGLRDVHFQPGRAGHVSRRGLDLRAARCDGGGLSVGVDGRDGGIGDRPGNLRPGDGRALRVGNLDRKAKGRARLHQQLVVRRYDDCRREARAMCRRRMPGRRAISRKAMCACSFSGSSPAGFP